MKKSRSPTTTSGGMKKGRTKNIFNRADKIDSVLVWLSSHDEKRDIRKNDTHVKPKCNGTDIDSRMDMLDMKRLFTNVQ
jgi:hypothetical protein